MNDLEKLESPQNRKVIVVLEVSDYEFERSKKENKYFKNDEIVIIDLSNYRLKENKIYKKLYNDGLLSNGNVLLQDPYYWDRYSIAQNPDNLIGDNIKTKYGLFSNFCGYLGAKNVTIEHTILKNSEGIFVGEAGFKKIAGAKVNVSQDRANKIVSSLRLNRGFKNPGIDVEKAEQLLEKCHLKNDQGFLEILDIHDRLQHYETTINLTSESNNILKVAAEITLPTWSLTAEFQNKLKTQEVVNIEISVDFY